METEVMESKNIEIEAVPSTSTDNGGPPKKKSKKKTKIDSSAKKTDKIKVSAATKPVKRKVAKNGQPKNNIDVTVNNPEQVTEDTEQIQLSDPFLSEVKIQHKLETYVRNDMTDIVVDEISLEGLDGITIEALWTRISQRISEPLPFSTEFENMFWEIVRTTDTLQFYLLEQPRSKLIIFDRFKCIDWDTGHLTEPEEFPEDIYPFSPISEQDSGNLYFGSCANFKSRMNITDGVRQMSLVEVENKYGLKLIIVADQVLRNRALGLEHAKSLNKLSNLHYSILERIGRSRKLGEVTAGKRSLLQVCDSKNLFYLRKQLQANCLITKQQFCLRNVKYGSISALLFHLPRLYKEYKSMKVMMMEQIVDILKRKPNHRIEYLELKKMVGLEYWAKGVQKLIKSPEFKQYVHTDVTVPYRAMYPNAQPKEWKVKNGSKEKFLRVLELIDPQVNMLSVSKEEDVKEESSDDEPIGELALNISVYNQAYNLIYESGSKGLTLKQVQKKFGLDFYITRVVLNNLCKRNLLDTRALDYGRAHILKYYVRSFNEQKAQGKLKKEKSPSTTAEEVDDETLSFIADVLEVDKQELIPKQKDEVAIEIVNNDPFKGHYDFIREYRTKNRLERYNKKTQSTLQNSEGANEDGQRDKALEREKYESIFKNEDSYYYPMDLSLEYKRIEPLELNNPDDNECTDIIRSIITKEEKDSNFAMNYNYFDNYQTVNLDQSVLSKIETCTKPRNVKILWGSSENASTILKKYLFLSIDVSVEHLLKTFKHLMQDIQGESNLNALEFPKDLLSDDDECLSANDDKDNTSLAVNLEETEQIQDVCKKEEDAEVKAFKMKLLNNFQNNNCVFNESDTYLHLDTPIIERGEKRKLESTEETLVPKRIKLESECNEDADSDNQQLSHLSEDVDTILKKVTNTIKMDIYMGKNPMLVSHCLDEDNIETTIFTTERVTTTEIPKKFTDKALPQRTVARANIMLDTIRREKVVSDIAKLTNAIRTVEKEKKLFGMVDRKSVDRLLNRLVVFGYIKIFKIVLKYENVLRCKNIVCMAPVDITSIIQVYIDQMKIAFFIYAKRKSDLTKVQPAVAGSSVDKDTPDSYEEIAALTSNRRRPKYKHSRNIAKQYGYLPKFAKIKIMHELLFYLIHSYDGQAVSVDEIPSLFKQFHVKMESKTIRELGTVYKRELSWRMFIPPLPKYKTWPNGWALICDVILRLPLSIFVKIFNIAYIIPELIPMLNDPVRKHVLLKNVPADIRNACLHNRKCIFSIHEILCHLCYIGLLQFGVQKLKEKEQQFIYLNRRAILYDTTTSDEGYHEVSKKDYPVLQFYFESQAILENYWSKLWNISVNTKLGQRYSMLQKTITLLDIHAKPDMVKSVIPKTSKDTLAADVGYIPGDRLGACGFDSSTWVHVKRNWVWSNAIKKRLTDVATTTSIVGTRRKHLEQVKVKSIKYKDLQRELSKKKLKKPQIRSDAKVERKTVTKRSKKNPVVRKVLPRPPSKKLKIAKFDDLDKRIMKKMGKTRAIWSEDEDINIIICHFAKKFLTSTNRKTVISPLIVRDVMHRLCPNKRRKTTLACARRCVKLLKEDKSIGNERYAYQLESDKYLQKIFSKFRNSLADEKTTPDEQVHIAFVYLVAYLASSCRNKFKDRQKILEGDVVFDYLPNKDIAESFRDDDAKDRGILFQNPQSTDDIKVNVIKDIIHSSVGWRSDNSDLPLMLYRAYQHFPDVFLRDAVTWMRKTQIVAGKKISTKHWNVKEGIRMAGNLLHHSFTYCFKQITRYPDYIYPEAYQMFISIYNRHDVEREFLRGKFEQGHGLGLSEIASMHNILFSFKIPDDLLILDPKISDHSQLIQELAVRYKFLIHQKRSSHEGDDQEKFVGDPPESVGVEKAIEVIFEAQKRKDLSQEDDASKKILMRESGVVQLTPKEAVKTTKKLAHNNEEKQKTKAPSTSKKPIEKSTEKKANTEPNEDTMRALQELTNYLGNKQGDNVLRISDLAYLLTKGLFPELDDDEERLEKLNKHFLIMYPSSTFHVPEKIMGENWAEEILIKARVKGEEIQEMIRKDCIVKNTSHDEEVSNSMIDIGGDDEDIELAFVVINFIKIKGSYGASSAELKNEFSHMTHNLELYEIINVLIKVGLIFRTGIKDIRFVHVSENEIWTVGLDNDRPISELNLNSLGVRLKLMPWIRINSTLNLKVLHNWMYVLLSHCLTYPFVMLNALMKRFNFLKPVDLFSLLQYLETLDCLKIYAYIDAKPVTLYSTFENLRKRPMNILDDFDNIFVETNRAAIIRMGAFRYKGETDIEIPFD